MRASCSKIGKTRGGCMLTNDAASELAQGAFRGTQEFAQLIRKSIQLAAQQGWREMVWSDASFEDWPLRERAVVDALQSWANSNRKLTLLAQNFDALPRLHPRFVTWRCQWDHILECRVNKRISDAEFPSAIWTPAWCLRRLDRERSTGVAGAEAQRRLLLKEELDECLRYSAPGFPATVLGL
jgi:hypothetical protein